MKELWGDHRQTSRTAAEKADFFRQSKYAMFIHWGLYSQAGNLWNGVQYHGISEWLMRCREIPVRDYERLAAEFNPTAFDADAWVALAREAGMRYVVFTAKHHDGFALFKSSHPYNIVDATPFGRDPVRELSEACRRAGLGFGVYYSQFQDWHEINGWDPVDGKTPFEAYFEGKCLPQIRELLTQYGPLSMIWFDTPGTMTAEQSRRIVDLMRELQPNALTNSRIGNGVGEYATLGDHELPVRRIDGLWETIDTTNDTWGYSRSDSNWLDDGEILRRLIGVVARGGNYMLNVGPDSFGVIPPVIAGALRRAGQWLARHGETLYGAQPSPWEFAQTWGDCTRQGSRLYFHLFDWRPGAVVRCYGLRAAIRSVRWRKASEEGERPAFRQNDGWLEISLPLGCGTEPVEVLELETEGEAGAESRRGVDSESPTRLDAEFAQLRGCTLESFSWMEKFGEWKHRKAVACWQWDGEAAWEVAVAAPGLYKAFITYCDPCHRAWELRTDEAERIVFWARDAESRGEVKRFVAFPAGVLEFHTSGNHRLALTPVLSDADPGTAPGLTVAAISLQPYNVNQLTTTVNPNPPET